MSERRWGGAVRLAIEGDLTWPVDFGPDDRMVIGAAAGCEGGRGTRLPVRCPGRRWSGVFGLWPPLTPTGRRNLWHLSRGWSRLAACGCMTCGTRPRAPEVIVAIPVDAGRPGDIWRLRADDRPVRVQRRSEHSVSFQSDAEPTRSGHGIDSGDWGHTLQRFREDPETLYAGDRAHVFVPETEVYILEIGKNEYKASGKGWVAWRTGQPPTWEFAEYGLFLDPASEWCLAGELVYRPFPMLDDGAQVADSRGRQWTFTAPFSFIGEDGERGTPTWPLVVAGDDEGTRALNDTSDIDQRAEWSARSGVGSDVFDLELPDW